MNAPLRTLPLTRPLVIATVPSGGRDIRVEATAAECAALARAFRLPAVTSLAARFHVKPSGSAVKVTGDVTGVVMQTCTVSLEEFEARIEEPVDLTFMAETGLDRWMAEHKPDPNVDLAYEVDPPDAIQDGKIDLGAVAAEFLALGLDPYPRKPGLNFEPTADPGGADVSPFAALAGLKKS